MTFDPATDTLWTDAQVEQRWNRKPGYCSELRARGAGPRFVRLSARAIRYRFSDIVEFEQRNTFQSNAEVLAAGGSNGDPEAA
jgi:hypothetical protein